MILLEWTQTEFPTNARAQVARLITIVMVISAATGVASITLASIVAATAMILLQCLNHRQAARSLDLRIYLVIAAALAMGVALETTGAATMIAEIVGWVASPYGYLQLVTGSITSQRALAAYPPIPSAEGVLYWASQPQRA